MLLALFRSALTLRPVPGVSSISWWNRIADQIKLRVVYRETRLGVLAISKLSNPVEVTLDAKYLTTRAAGVPFIPEYFSRPLQWRSHKA